LISETKAARDDHGQEPSIQDSTGWPFALRKRTRPGKLSSNGPRFAAGYQMKWAMPREGNSSPLFQEVSPDTVPAHSFFQIPPPISEACRSDIVPAFTPGIARIRSRKTRNLI